MPTKTQLRTGPGRPPTGKTPRDTQVLFYLTEDDARYLDTLTEELGFRSRSQMWTAIAERLILGGFSGIAFAKLGWQFANLIEKSPVKGRGFYFGVRPFPPLIGDEDDPTGAEIVPFLEGIKKQIRKEQAA